MTEPIHPAYSQVSPSMARPSVPSKPHGAPISTPAAEVTPCSPGAANAGGLLAALQGICALSNGDLATKWNAARKAGLAAIATVTNGAAGVHPDDAAVDQFASAMKAKMAASRAKGRDGWEDPAHCPTERLQAMLSEHVTKGDPVDVGNFAMMLFCRGDRTASEKLTGGYDEALCARAYGAAWPKVKGYIDGLNATRAELRNCDKPTAVGAGGQLKLMVGTSVADGYVTIVAHLNRGLHSTIVYTGQHPADGQHIGAQTLPDALAPEMREAADRIETLERESAELWKALNDLSFECFGVCGTTAPSVATYNQTFAVIDKHREKCSKPTIKGAADQTGGTA